MLAASNYSFLSLSLFSKAVIIFFRQLLKLFASNFSTWSVQWWSVISTYSGQYSVPSCPVCTHLDRVIGYAQDCVFQQWTIYLGILPSFIRLTYPSQSNLRWRSIVNTVGSPYLDSITVFDHLLIQDIPSIFRIESI